MQLRYIICFLILSLILHSCNKTDAIGLEIQPQEDKINTVVDTFHLESKDYIFKAVSAQCVDSMSMLLGEYYNEKYGNIKADLVVQLAPPVNYQFPDAQYKIQPDSLVLYMFYRSYFGASNEPFEVSIYELNKNTPNYYTQYLTDFDVTQFLDINDSQLLGRKLLTSVDQSKTEAELERRTYIPTVKYMFTETQMQRFFNMPKSAYSSTKSFLEHFKGLYITTSYGKSTMLYLFEIDLRLFYHYSYQTKTKAGNDTTITVNTYINYPASKDVRQINHIKATDIEPKINKRDTVNYLTTTSGIYPKITLPIERIRGRIKDSLPDKNLKNKIFVNSANISLEITERDTTATAMPIPPALFMIPVSEADNFIKTGSLKIYKENKAQLIYYISKKREYIGDIAYLLNKVIKDNSQSNTEYLLIPVDIYTNSNKQVTECRPTKRLGAATIRSGKSQYSPMRLELVYSGF